MRALAPLAARVVLAFFFGYAALTKLGDMRLFAEQVANYQLLPAGLVPAAAAAVVGVEVACVLLLLVGLFTRPTALVVALLLLAFIGALSLALARGLNLTCGCFGGTEPATWGTVARDVALLGVACVPLRLGAGALALGRSADPGPGARR